MNICMENNQSHYKMYTCYVKDIKNLVMILFYHASELVLFEKHGKILLCLEFSLTYALNEIDNLFQSS